jgi:precorrin-2 dehydrogenase/sirohydrochlorin ferrochelatase
MYLPLHIDMRGKKVLIVGFGEVGKKRAQKLLKAGAGVSVIDQKKMRTTENIKLIRKKLAPNNLPSFKEFFLVVVSTNDTKLNAAIVRKAKLEGCLVNRADARRGGDVIFPAVVETGRGTISFTTFGKNPKLSKRVKEALERELSKG